MKNFYCHLVLFFIVVLFSCSNNNHVDNYLNIAEDKVRNDPKTTLNLLRDIEQDTISMTNEQKIRFFLLRLNAQDLNLNAPIDIDQAKKLVHFCEKQYSNTEYCFRAYYYLAGAYRDKFDYPQAVSFYKKALSLVECKNVTCKRANIVRCYMQLAFVLNDTYLAQESINTLFKALKFSDSPDLKADILNSIAISYMNLKQDKIAANYFEKAYNTKGLTQNKKMEIACAQIDFFIYKNDKQKVLERKKGLFSLNLTDEWGEEEIYNQKAMYFNYFHQTDSASYYWKKMFETTCNPTYKQIALGNLFKISKQKNELQKANEYAQLYINYNDTIQHELESEKVAKAQQLYNYNEYKTLSEEKEKKNSTLWNYIVGIIALSIVLIVTLAYYHRWKQQKNKIKSIEMLKTISNKDKEVQDEQKKISYLSSEIDKFNDEVNTLQSQIKEKDTENKDKELQISSLKEQIKHLNEELQVHIDKEDMLQKQLVDDSHEVSILQKELSVNTENVVRFPLRHPKFHQKVMDYKGEMPTALWKEYLETFNNTYPLMEPFLEKNFTKSDITDIQIIYLTCGEITTKQIGELLNVTYQYINTRRKRIFCKMTGQDKCDAIESRNFILGLRAIACS